MLLPLDVTKDGVLLLLLFELELLADDDAAVADDEDEIFDELFCCLLLLLLLLLLVEDVGVVACVLMAFDNSSFAAVCFVFSGLLLSTTVLAVAAVVEVGISCLITTFSALAGVLLRFSGITGEELSEAAACLFLEFTHFSQSSVSGVREIKFGHALHVVHKVSINCARLSSSFMRAGEGIFTFKIKKNKNNLLAWQNAFKNIWLRVLKRYN